MPGDTIPGTSLRSGVLLATIAFGRAGGVIAASVLLTGCPPTNPCSRGQPVTIRQPDPTAPQVGVDIRGRGGALFQVTAGVSGPSQVPMPKGAVTIDAIARDPEGIRKVVMILRPLTCTTARATGQRTCTAATAQTFTNEDLSAVGATGCTERMVSTGITVDRTLTTSRDEVERSVEVLVFGQNFGGRNTNTSWKQILPLP